MKEFILIQWNGLTPSFGFFARVHFFSLHVKGYIVGMEIPLDSLEMLKCLSLLSV